MRTRVRVRIMDWTMMRTRAGMMRRHYIRTTINMKTKNKDKYG